jgi:hypothetical protein
MTLYAKRTLDDGSVVVHENNNDGDREVAVLKPGQWEQITVLPYEQHHAKLAELVAANQADPTGGRSELDEQTMETAQNASSGEAHQDQERA